MTINLKKLDEYMSHIGLKLVDTEDSILEYTVNDKINLVDNCGYLFSLSMQNMSTIKKRNTSPVIFFNKNPYTHENINNYLKINNIKLILKTTNPRSATSKLSWDCCLHNEECERSWNSVKNGSIFCKKCDEENFKRKRCHTIEYIKEKATLEYNITILSDVYINNEELLSFKCNSHPEFGVQRKSWGNIITKSHPCLKCSKEKLLKKMRKTHDTFLKEVNLIHGEKYDILSKYTKGTDNINVYCNQCKNVFSIRANHFLKGHGCGICTKSKGEERIKKILDDYNIKYIREFRFDDCVGIKRRLPFDFYIPNQNICIEFQGIQHYKPVERFGGEKQFEIQKYNDECKRKYCTKNNIKLIEISYLEKDIYNTIKNNLIEEVI